MKSRINRFFADMNDGRKEVEEDIGTEAGEEKVSTDGQAVTASIESDDVTVMPDHRLEERDYVG